MGRPPSVVEDYREWQRRLERYQTHEVNLDVFCLQEGVSRSTFYRWKRRLDNGVPETLQTAAAETSKFGRRAEFRMIVTRGQSLSAQARRKVSEAMTPVGGFRRLGRGQEHE